MPSQYYKIGVSGSSRKQLIELASKNAAQQRAANTENALAKGAQIEAAQKRFRWLALLRTPIISRNSNTQA